MSSTSACDKGPSDTAIDTRIGAKEERQTVEERKKPSIDKPRSSRNRQTDEMELEHQKARENEEQRAKFGVSARALGKSSL